MDASGTPHRSWAAVATVVMFVLTVGQLLRAVRSGAPLEALAGHGANGER